MELQNQCLVYIIAHLDEFTPSSLALLFTRLRCLLLVNLPAVDICQLERTEVVHGIDMWRNVWRNVSFQRLPVHVRMKLEHLTGPLPTEGSPLALYPGCQWVGRKRACYPLFAHVLNFPEILGNRKQETIVLYPYNHDVRT